MPFKRKQHKTYVAIVALVTITAALFLVVFTLNKRYLHVSNILLFILSYAALSFGYLIYKYVFSLMSSIEHLKTKKYTYLPFVSIIIPVYNEGAKDLEQCIISACDNDYPHKEVIVVDDGSDKSEVWSTIQRLKRTYGFKAIQFSENKGKREGMNIGFREAKGSVVITMDSDSVIYNGDSIRELVAPLEDRRVGAVSGNVEVLNRDDSLPTRLQWARYWIAFNVEKASQSAYDSVTCCSGPFSAYRKEYLMKFLDEWINQVFLGQKCTYGDDRGLTTIMLREGYKVKFARYALCLTNVPTDMAKFTKQQIRWKKSFCRENYYISSFITDKNIFMQIEFFWFWLIFWLGYVAKGVAVYLVFTGRANMIGYAIMILFVSIMHYFYAFVRKPGNLGLYGIGYGILNEVYMSWLFWYALFTLKETKWGTR
jgi:hyaluronan synthase